MNCNDIRAVLAVVRPDSRDLDLPELASEKLHLEQCADCRARFESQQQSDRDLSRAMRGVAIPADLNSRLLASLTAAIAPPAVAAPALASQTVQTQTADAQTAAVSASVVPPPQPVERPRRSDQSWTRRRAATVISAAMMLLALCGWWLFQTQRQTLLSVPDLVALCHQQEALTAPVFQNSFRPDLPVTEIRLPAPSLVLKPLSLRDQGQELGALFACKVPGARGRLLSVVLVVVDLKRVQVPGLAGVGTSFQAAGVLYPKPHGYATRVWRVGQNLYVCYVQSKNPEDLDGLKAQFQTS